MHESYWNSPFLGDMLFFGGVVGQPVCCEWVVIPDGFSSLSLEFWLVRHSKILGLGMFLFLWLWKSSVATDDFIFEGFCWIQLMINWWCGDWWFGILGIPLSNHPFHKGILGIQTTNPNHPLTISWLKDPVPVLKMFLPVDGINFFFAPAWGDVYLLDKRT